MDEDLYINSLQELLNIPFTIYIMRHMNLYIFK